MKPLYYRLPAAALENVKLTRSALILLAVLIDASDYGPPEITIDDLCAAAGIGRTTCKDALRQLVGAGLLRIERTGRGSIYFVGDVLPPKQRKPPRDQQKKQPDSQSSSIPPEMLRELMKMY